MTLIKFVSREIRNSLFSVGNFNSMMIWYTFTLTCQRHMAINRYANSTERRLCATICACHTREHSTIDLNGAFPVYSHLTCTGLTRQRTSYIFTIYYYYWPINAPHIGFIGTLSPRQYRFNWNGANCKLLALWFIGLYTITKHNSYNCTRNG